MTPRTAVLAVVVAGTLLRLPVAAMTGIRNLGDYIVVIARQLPLSTVDHPPMTFWIFGAWMRLTGTEDSFVVRLPSLALFAASTWLMYRVTALAVGGQKGAWAGVWAAALLNLSAVFGGVVGVWILPDVPLVFFLLLAALCLVRLLLVSPPPARPLLWWLAAGLAGGGALLSKYSAVFLFLGAFAFILSDRDSRKVLTTPGPWLGALVAALCFAPVPVWNAGHDWASFAFQGGRAIPSGGVSPLRVGESILLQAGILAPWIFVPLVAALVGAIRIGPKDRVSWFFVCLAVGPIVVFTGLTLFRDGFPHWSLPGWLFVFPMVGASLADARGKRLKTARFAAVASAFALVAVIGVLIADTRSGFLGRLTPMLTGRSDPAFLVRDWPELKTALAARIETEHSFVAAPDWESTAAASYALGPDVPVVCVCAAEQQFRYQSDKTALAGRDAFIVGWPEAIAGHMPRLSRAFAELGAERRIELTLGETNVASLAIVEARDFQPDVAAK